MGFSRYVFVLIILVLGLEALCGQLRSGFMASGLSRPALDSLMAQAFKRQQYPQALGYAQQGLLQAQADLAGDSILGTYKADISAIYRQMGDYQASELHCLEALEHFQKALGEESPLYASALMSLARLYKDLNLLNQAEIYFLRALEIRRHILGTNHLHYAHVLNDLATLYLSQQRYAQAEPLYLQAKAIYQDRLGPKHPHYAAILSNLGQLYFQLKRYQIAEKLYKQVADIELETLGSEHLYHAYTQINLARLYAQTQRLDLAQKAAAKAAKIRAKQLGQQHPLYALSLYYQGEFAYKAGEYEQAVLYCQQALIANSYGLDMSNIILLKMFKFKNLQYFNQTLQLYLQILQAQFNQTQERAYLQTAYLLAQSALTVNEAMRQGFSHAKDQLRALSESYPLMLQGLETAWLLERPETERFAFSESHKAVLLWQSVQSYQAQRFGDLPEDLAQKERSLEDQILALEAKLMETKNIQETDTLHRKLLQTRQSLGQFQKTLAQSHPRYLELKHGQKKTDLKAIQAHLSEDMALIDYTISDDFLHIFYLDKTQIKHLVQTLNRDSLLVHISRLRLCLSDFTQLQTQQNLAFERYTQEAFWFYQHLLALPLSLTNPKIKHLLIIPDGPLAHLPFEVFLSELPSNKNSRYKDLPYLLHRYQFSYAYSASLWCESLESPRISAHNGKILAMAASYPLKPNQQIINLNLSKQERIRQQLSPLPAAKVEVSRLAKRFRGYFAFEEQATEAVFKREAGRYALIHLAMHGFLDEEAPILSGLAFSQSSMETEDDLLQAYEISKMQLQADLVVLSACETGFGRIETGNGTASLGRAFLYAGVPSLVVSLWQINDESTAIIMDNFYQNLAQGQTKPSALQQAKLAYLQGVSSDLAAHPLFWAAFVQIGDSAPLTLSNTYPWYYWLSLFLVCFAFILYVYKRFFGSVK